MGVYYTKLAGKASPQNFKDFMAKSGGNLGNCFVKKIDIFKDISYFWENFCEFRPKITILGGFSLVSFPLLFKGKIYTHVG